MVTCIHWSACGQLAGNSHSFCKSVTASANSSGACFLRKNSNKWQHKENFSCSHFPRKMLIFPVGEFWLPVLRDFLAEPCLKNSMKIIGMQLAVDTGELSPDLNRLIFWTLLQFMTSSMIFRYVSGVWSRWIGYFTHLVIRWQCCSDTKFVGLML